MIYRSTATALLLAAVCHTSTAWSTIQTSKAIPGVRSSSIQSYRLPSISPSGVSRAVLFATESGSTEDGSDAPKRKRKRKKKVQVVADVDDDDDVDDATTNNKEEQTAPEPAKSTAPVLNLKPRDDAPVQLEVKKIVSYEPEPSAIDSVTSMLTSMQSIIGSKDKKSSSSTTTKSPSEKSKSLADDFGVSPLDDSLDQLLEDARLMTEEEKEAIKAGLLTDEDGTSIKSVIGNALSTIVTIDFFVVISFLVWFLAGIFCSSILKDDTVQILFNNNFEKLVQPALGLLMVAAVGGSFFNEEEQEYDL